MRPYRREFGYEIENVARSFFPYIEATDDIKDDNSIEDCITQDVTDTGDSLVFRVHCSYKGIDKYCETVLKKDLSPNEKELKVCRSVYDMLSDITGKAPPWGVLTGVRPAKRAADMLISGLSAEESIKKLQRDWYLAKGKAEIAVESAGASIMAKGLSVRESYSLYVSIPFCPSRCKYCSFVSKTIGSSYSLVDPYIDSLLKELTYVQQITSKHNLKLETVYVGGGTPTSISAAQLDRLLAGMTDLFDIGNAREFTVEAGRPDTITGEKLRVLRNYGVDRISINPQTGNDRVLRENGRFHTSRDIEECFALARKAGIDNINADLIAGLAGDDLDSFKRTLDWLYALSPENITIHSLTRKRAATLREMGEGACPDVEKMIDYSRIFLNERDYSVYYMYRQKGTVDGLENSGYCLKGRECLYNIFIMDELHSIVSCGAGGVTKLVDPYSGKIQRVPNYKYPAEYIDGIESMMARKDEIDVFYTERA